MVDNSDLCLTNLKFLLCLEAMSGLKINFAKSELLILGCWNVDAARLVYLLNCKLGSFLFKYLGLPISPSFISSKDFSPVVQKVGNRVMPWRGRYYSSTVKTCSINAYLSSVPTYMMGFYRFPMVSHACFDKHHNNFY